MDIQEHLNYQEIKETIRKDYKVVAEKFVSIGYSLKKVRDAELYKEDGYSDIAEFALKEYGISRSTAYRFMQINDKFSIEGNSPELIPEYTGFGSGKLIEMLTLDSEELKLVTDRATKDDIREINKTHTEAKLTAVAPARQTSESLDFAQSKPDFDESKKESFEELKNIIFEYFNGKEKRQQLKELGELFRKDIEDIENEVAIVINPSKHSVFRKALTVLFLEEKVIKIKKFGSPTLEFVYTDFLYATNEIFDLSLEDPWVEYFGEPEEEKKIIADQNAEEKEEDEEDDTEEETEEPDRKPEVKKPEPPKGIPAPSKKNVPQKPEPAEVKEEVLPGQMNIQEFPEYLPEEVEKVTCEVISIEETSGPEETKEENKEEGPKVHDLKTDHIYFSDVLTNKKPFELRLNDRDYHVGDILRLHELINGQETGRTVDRLVNYMLENYTGLVDKYCILGIEPVGEEIWKETK